MTGIERRNALMDVYSKIEQWIKENATDLYDDQKEFYLGNAHKLYVRPDGSCYISKYRDDRDDRDDRDRFESGHVMGFVWCRGSGRWEKIVNNVVVRSNINSYAYMYIEHIEILLSKWNAIKDSILERKNLYDNLNNFQA